MNNILNDILTEYDEAAIKMRASKIRLAEYLNPILEAMDLLPATSRSHNILQVNPGPNCLVIAVEINYGGFSYPRTIRLSIPNEILESAVPVAEATAYRRKELAEQKARYQQEYEEIMNDNNS